MKAHFSELNAVRFTCLLDNMKDEIRLLQEKVIISSEDISTLMFLNEKVSESLKELQSDLKEKEG